MGTGISVCLYIFFSRYIYHFSVLYLRIGLKAGDLSGKKEEAADNFVKNTWIRWQHSDCMIKAISCHLSVESSSRN